MINPRYWPLAILTYVIGAVGVPTNALAQVPRPAELIFPADQLEKYILPAQNNQVLQQQELERRQDGRAPRFAQAIPVQINPMTQGRWDEIGDLSVWRLRLSSPAAYSLNLGFTQYHMPSGGKLFIYDLIKSKVSGPFTPADNESHNELWTPVFPGDELIIEVQLPVRRQSELELELSYVNHDFLGFGQLNSGSCNLDIVCGAADGWQEVDSFRDASRSVGVYSLQGSLVCTGFLVNNSQGNCTPYFMTANHCEITPNNAASVVVYWNFQNSTCRQPDSPASGQDGDGNLDDFNTGSIFRSSWANSDFCLIELDDPVSETANTFFAGWSAKNEIPQGKVASIHHPFTDEKRISFSERLTHFGFWGSSATNADGNHIIVPSWTTGTTQSGSSGAPLFNSQGQVVGQLHGGDAACGNSSYDSFGRFYSSWEGGGTPNSRLKDWLDPLNMGKLSLAGRDQGFCDFWVNATFAAGAVCAGGKDTLRVQFGPGFTSTSAVEIGAVPAPLVSSELQQNPDPNSTDLVFVWSANADAPAGTYTSYVQTPYDTVYFQFTIIDQIPASPDLLYPPDQSENQALQLLLNWTGLPSATYYQIQVARDAGFSDLLLEQHIQTDTALLLSELDANVTYYWRVRSGNVCGEADWSPVFTFTTADVTCNTKASSDGPITIPSTTAGTITSSIDLDIPGTIASIEILDLNIQHRWVGDLRISLRSPSGKEIVLLDRAGFPSSLYGCDGSNLLLNFSQDVGISYPILENTCGSISPAISGTFQPLESLSAFMGEKAAGVWKLIVNDQADEDGGQFISWQLNICTIPEVIPLLLGLDDFYSTCADDPLQVDIAISKAFTGGSVVLTLDQTPIGASAIFSKNPAAPGDTISLVLDNLLVIGNQSLVINATDGTEVGLLSIDIDIQDIPDPVTLVEPEPGGVISEPVINFVWTPSNASSYRLEVASDPDFLNIVHTITVTPSNYTLEMPEAAGAVFWRIFALNPCGESPSEVSGFTFSPTATSNLEDGRYVQVYPNPFNDLIHLRFSQSLAFPLQIRLLDINGRVLLTDEAGAGILHTTLTLNDLSAGVYLLEMQYQGRRYVQRMIRGQR